MDIEYKGLGVVYISGLERSRGAYLTQSVGQGINLRVVAYDSTIEEYNQALDEAERELRELNHGEPLRSWADLMQYVVHR